ncbi:LL-diaminopimelate aminotransferase [Sphingomicrobium astaxanthinifaciens]|uniref:LL-diaminopimelate aminotransferase n=1 Tax=Sphingomicrobium astaxanthinifaciens TaxID=1227949 RepID=UPI001FCB73DA|nr:LL-diaminopimelate aminotransferase [Sphingomicrobium astaxanthinifaciens]MCJ7420855.1 LL-diaminopimelate aminotransferase [Sphingomicrobium astaxanthinifaciens]
MSDFYRIERLPPYVFAEVNAMKAEARARGIDIVDLGMGNPDGAPPAHVIDKLCEVARKPDAHRYSASAGIKGLRRAQADYYARRFGVRLDPDREVCVTLGSKEGFANLAQAITAPGDVVLTPNPSYPIHHFGFIIAGAAIRSIPAAPGPDFLDKLEKAMRYSVPRPKVLVVGYPSNPTAQVVGLDFYAGIVAFARDAGLKVISDLAYAEIYYGDQPTPSILQIEGAREIAVEFTSLSKTYSMAGWRIGFAVGNPAMIAALKRVKSYLDYGAFTPIQAAAVAALNGPQDIVEENRRLYRKRRDVLVESFARAGWDIPVPEASMFAWAPIPERFRGMGSVGFAKHALETAQVALAPGLGFGEEGEGFVRLALVENEQRLRQAARGIKKMLER